MSALKATAAAEVTAGAALRAARTKAKMSQGQLSKRLGVSKSAVSGWENGRDIPHATRLAGIARALAPHLDLTRYCEHLERAA